MDTHKQDDAVPVCVDLDGTLIRTDSLVEGIALLIKRHLPLLLLLPLWMLRGKAWFKERIAERVPLDVEFLPYRQQVLDLVRDAHGAGRRVVLCTGANQRYADAVAGHHDVFDEVIASTHDLNMTRDAKRAALVERYGEGGYDFIGNDEADLPAMQSARKAYLVAPTRGLSRRSQALGDVETLVPRGRLRPLIYLRQMRLHQWLKNLLLFLALLASGQAGHVPSLIDAAIAFVAFGFCASSIYVLNDLMDLRPDRRHPRKRNRPFASGAIPANHGLLMVPALAIIGFALAASLPLLFLLSLVLYYTISLTYNLWAKDIAVLDTLFLASLYTLRVIAGAAAISVVPSFWLLAFSMFFFLSVAMAKRYSELLSLDLPGGKRIPGRQYSNIDLDTIMSQGAASGYAAVLVMALYINSDAVTQNYSRPEVLWLTCPLMLYWINKLWLNARRDELHDDPLVWAIENRVSRGITAMFVVLMFLAV